MLLRKKNIFITITISIASGVLLTLSSIFAFTAIVTVLSFYIALKKTNLKDRRFVLSIMSIALALRFIAIIYAQYYCYSKGIRDILGDASSNFEMGKWAADVLTGKLLTQNNLQEELGSWNVHTLTYLYGIFFSSFGDAILVALKYINSLSIVISGWLIYDLTKKIHSSLAGKTALCIVLFWPTLFVWSITGLKESHLILGIVIIFWCLRRIIAGENIKQRILFSVCLILSAGYTIPLRYNILLPLIFANFSIVAAYLAFLWYRRKEYGVKKLFLLIAISCAVLLLKYRDAVYQMAKNYYQTMVRHHIAYLGSGGFNYNLIGDSVNYYTVPFFLKYLLGAWYHFLLEPLPWHIFSLSMLLSYPATLVWYAMLYFSIIGIIKMTRLGKTKEIFPFLTFVVLYTTAVGMSVANIGTMVRFRDTITPFIAVFASCGLARAAITRHAHLSC